MSVPKCKECSNHEYKTLKGMTSEGYGQRYHWCMLVSYSYNKNISALEFKTSPKWCPKRNER